jgi:hypothetical protein
MNNKKIIQVKKLFHDYEAKSIQAVCSCDYDELAQEIVKLFAIPDVSNRRELLNSFLNWEDSLNGKYNNQELNYKYIDDFLKTI